MDNLGVDLSQQAQVHFLHGNYSESALLYEQAIAANPDIRTNYWHLGIALLLLEQEEEAQIVWFSAISEGNEEQVGEWTKELVEVLIASAQNQQEAENYLGEWLLRQHIRHINCDYSDRLTNELYLILAAIRSDRLSRREFSEEELESSFLPAIQLLFNGFAHSCDNHLLFKACKQVKAHSLFLSEIFRQACLKYYYSKIEQSPEDAVLWCFLGNIYAEYRNYQQEDWQKAQGAYEKAISLAPNFAEAYYHYSNLLLDSTNRFGFPLLSNVIKYVEKAISLSPKYGDALYRLGTLLEAQGKSQESLSCFKEALESNPQNLKAYRRYHLLLPVIYEAFADIHFWRSRFENGLTKFDESISLDKLSDRINALESIACRTIFFLPYQGYNDLDLQRQYGQTLQRVMAANYPHWSQPLSMPELSNSNESKGKLRIGYVSSYFTFHSVGMMAMGYFKHCNHERFEIYAYHTGSRNDSMTEQFQEFSHAFYNIPESLESVCEQIRFDDLHILIFLDVGMDANTNLIAGLRLAPVQCVWAGHPETTGLPTIDYFLSSDAHEPKNAQQHYSEKLIRLPNLSHVYAKPSIPNLNKTRSDMGLPEDGLLYVSCQTPFKYLPQYDYLFPEIVKQVPSAKVVFCLSGREDSISVQILRNRIKESFERSGLDSEISCIFLDPLGFDSYLNLISLCDASLDTIGFTGSNTTLQAIACGLPVVTLPTELMRGRQSYGIFKTLGVMDTVASSEAEYIEIAVRLGSDSFWRESISQKMISNHHLLYDDVTCVKALEQFFVEVVSDYCPIE